MSIYGIISLCSSLLFYFLLYIRHPLFYCNWKVALCTVHAIIILTEKSSMKNYFQFLTTCAAKLAIDYQKLVRTEQLGFHVEVGFLLNFFLIPVFFQLCSYWDSFCFKHALQNTNMVWRAYHRAEYLESTSIATIWGMFISFTSKTYACHVRHEQH